MTLDEDGAFGAELAEGDELAVLDHTGVVVAVPQPEPPPPEPGLVVDGPAGEDLVDAGVVVYRFHATTAEGIANLVVSVNGAVIDLPAQPFGGVGVDVRGMLSVPVVPGPAEILFTLTASDGREATVTRSIAQVRSRPERELRYRGPAVALPLLSPVDGRQATPSDQSHMEMALTSNPRFRYVASDAKQLLNEELALVDAGYVDRKTAARAGRQLAGRYVVAGTLRRGSADIECFLRVIHSETGVVLATADAYGPAADAAAEERFFAAVSGRLRQVFPVLEGTVMSVADGGATATIKGFERYIGSMQLHVLTTHAAIRGADGKVLLPERDESAGIVHPRQVDGDRVTLRLLSGAVTEPGTRIVSE